MSSLPLIQAIPSTNGTEMIDIIKPTNAASPKEIMKCYGA
ncbi:uncharacterized protein METZ01_LOCUS155518 [marine metagenome]|uniref:Uncharacterized protein n=1 Tax=marine metagenome TaxID=408172 RepID=A0A382AMQ3_9ZZZZ